MTMRGVVEHLASPKEGVREGMRNPISGVQSRRLVGMIREAICLHRTQYPLAAKNEGDGFVSSAYVSGGRG